VGVALRDFIGGHLTGLIGVEERGTNPLPALLHGLYWHYASSHAGRWAIQ
jgi:hypothetical protein